MVEVDKERGRIGLRLADDPDIAGKTAEELAAVGTGDSGGGGGGDRGGRAAAATVAAADRATVAVAAAAASHRRDRARDRLRWPLTGTSSPSSTRACGS